ncbi:MAG: hypothetical protein ABJQ14_10945, partial [Hyphomicrobiales bacterium]
QIMFLSKMTAATLDDMNYVVDPSAVSFDGTLVGLFCPDMFKTTNDAFHSDNSRPGVTEAILQRPTSLL